jgi:hypothetical protein
VSEVAPASLFDLRLANSTILWYKPREKLSADDIALMHILTLLRHCKASKWIIPPSRAGIQE